MARITCLRVVAVTVNVLVIILVAIQTVESVRGTGGMALRTRHVMIAGEWECVPESRWHPRRSRVTLLAILR